VFLREITVRLTEGLKDAIPDLQERVDHILTKQVFGIGITQITSLLARRSVYCSKLANGEHSIASSFTSETGNIWFERTEHTWEGNKCRYCSAPKVILNRSTDIENYAYPFIHTGDIRAWVAEQFGGNMQFDVVIGNPPYQMSTGGGTATQQAVPIYQEFVNQAKSLESRYLIMVIPSRWFSGGMPVLDTFRREMLSDHHLRVMVDFPDSRDAFVGVDVAGGVNYFLRDLNYNGPCAFTTVSSGQSETVLRNLDDYPVFIRSSKAISIVEKVVGHDGFKPLTDSVSAISPFGLPTSFRGEESKKGLKSPISLRSTGGTQWTERTNVTKNHEWIDKWKVLLSATTSEHAGQADRNGTRRIFSRIEVLPPNTVVTHSYLIVGPTDTEAESRNLANFLRTKFVRHLVSLVVATQHISRTTFQFVPDLPMDRAWTDKELYKKYKLTKDEIAFVESMIRPMESNDE
jgi:site-specific DNA-methyltransferase (adenine-specific)